MRVILRYPGYIAVCGLFQSSLKEFITILYFTLVTILHQFSTTWLLIGGRFDIR